MHYILIILIYSTLYSYDDKDKEINKNVSSIIHLQYGFLFPNNNSEFFEIYKKDLGGFKSNFNYKPSLSISNKFIYNNDFRVGILVSRYSYDFYEEYEQLIIPNTLFYRNIIQNISINDYPVLGIMEYIPRKENQFKSYVGLATGILVSKVYWEEEISTFDWDQRRGGIVYDNLFYYPMISVYFGTELGFDKINKESFLGGLTIEPRINYIYRKMDFFSPLNKQIPDAYFGINREIWINNFIFELNLGLTLNFYIKK